MWQMVTDLINRYCTDTFQFLCWHQTISKSYVNRLLENLNYNYSCLENAIHFVLQVSRSGINRWHSDGLSRGFLLFVFRSSRPRGATPGNESWSSEEDWAVAGAKRRITFWNGRGNGVCGFVCSVHSLDSSTWPLLCCFFHCWRLLSNQI